MKFSHVAQSIVFALSTVCALPAAVQALDVVTTVKPVYALVASVMGDVHEPYLIVKGSASPHTYSLRPSDAKALERAEVVFWVGHGLETFLVDPLQTLSAKANIVALDEAPDLELLSFREGGPFEAHEDVATDDHGHGEMDTHIWLDPLNAKVMVAEIRDVLLAADPENAVAYADNAEKTSAALDALVAEVTARLAPVKDKPFVVFHDAYQYFENRFGLRAAGSITVSPDVIPGAQRIAEIQATIKSLGATCVFAEPQFQPKLVAVATEGSAAKVGILDPLGADLEDGPELYFDLIRNMASSMAECLAD